MLRAQARAQQVLQNSVAEVARRLGAATDDLLDLPDEDLAAAVAEPDEDGAGGEDSEEGFAARAALLRAQHLALLTGDAAAGDGVRAGLDRLLQVRRGLTVLCFIKDWY